MFVLQTKFIGSKDHFEVSKTKGFTVSQSWDAHMLMSHVGL